MIYQTLLYKDIKITSLLNCYRIISNSGGEAVSLS